MAINARTVLVLGAGASMPYGFPSGASLLEKIVKDTDDTGTDLWAILKALGHFPNDIRSFSEQLRRSARMSVDAFLEHRSDLTRIGKRAIAAALIPFENANHVRGDWYQYLFGAMGAKFDDFKSNNLSVITFNYDRSFEFHLLTAIKNSYGKSSDDAAKALATIPIIHVHGQLGQLLQAASLDAGLSIKGRPYIPQLDVDLIEHAASKIKIIHEAEDDSPEFQQARQLLLKAERVCFLGFGYDKRNLGRLFGDIKAENLGALYGSAFGFTEKEKEHIAQGALKEIEFGKRNEGNLDVLRETGVLIS